MIPQQTISQRRINEVFAELADAKRMYENISKDPRRKLDQPNEKLHYWDGKVTGLQLVIHWNIRCSSTKGYGSMIPQQTISQRRINEVFAELADAKRMYENISKDPSFRRKLDQPNEKLHYWDGKVTGLQLVIRLLKLEEGKP